MLSLFYWQCVTNDPARACIWRCKHWFECCHVQIHYEMLTVKPSCADAGLTFSVNELSRPLYHKGLEQDHNQPNAEMQHWADNGPVQVHNALFRYIWALICRCWAYFLGLGSPMHAVDHSTTMAQNRPRISPVQVHCVLFIVEPWYADVELIFLAWASPCMQ